MSDFSNALYFKKKKLVDELLECLSSLYPLVNHILEFLLFKSFMIWQFDFVYYLKKIADFRGKCIVNLCKRRYVWLSLLGLTYCSANIDLLHLDKYNLNYMYVAYDGLFYYILMFYYEMSFNEIFVLIYVYACKCDNCFFLNMCA